MKTLGNIIWFIFGGFFISLAWYFLGLILYITIIGIPFARQCFKAGRLTLAPFGKKVDVNFGKHPIANTIWVILVGWGMGIGYLIAGVFQCITIIGIPFGLQSFKFAKLGFIPFGAKIVL